MRIVLLLCTRTYRYNERHEGRLPVNNMVVLNVRTIINVEPNIVFFNVKLTHTLTHFCVSGKLYVGSLYLKPQNIA